ncbi:MAG: GtrA family protein [Ruminococcaceae bacterium]|nr:GtrA family protein [Oscillospiraceae bacterium]
MMLQILKFGVVGVIAAIVDYGVLIGLKELLYMEVLIASAISFCASVVVNYLLSMAFVFQSNKQNKLKEFILFVLLSVGGLCLNELILWIAVYFSSVYYLVAKLFATMIVMVYNFVTRKIFLESKGKRA